MITLILFAWAGGFIGGLAVGSGITVRRDRDTAASTRSGPTTPKPQPHGGRLIVEGFWPGGYQPYPQQGTPNPPPSEP